MELLKQIKSRANSIDLLVAQNLRKRRIELGITTKELAIALNVTIQQIRKYEAAKNRISGGNLFYLAQALKVPINYFFGLHPECEPELWINEEKILTIKGGGINIKVNGMQLSNLSKR